MKLRIFLPALFAIPALFASADKNLPIERTSNESVEILAHLLDKDEIVKMFGSDLGGNIVVVRTTVRPLTETPIRIDYDDFFLLDTGNGERSAPYEPSQIAGSSVLVVTPTGTRGGFGGQPGGPRWGGIPGTMGRPRQLPGDGGAAGNTGGVATSTEAKVETDASKEKSNPLLTSLKQQALPETAVTDKTTGLLYFEIEAKKIKPKDLELHYKTTSGRIAMRFQP